MHLADEAIELLRALIATPSLSREEDAAASLMAEFLRSHGAPVQRHGNNVWSVHPSYDASRPTLLLNSHLDTVKANADWTRDPLDPAIEGDVLYGLGSNDAGGPLVSYAASFLHFLQRDDLSINIVFAATAEEEISGAGGIVATVPLLPSIDFAMVGEPTEMMMAIAEKGLMVLRCVAMGRSGHAARNEGLNAIDIAMRDIAWFHSHRFDKESSTLGPIKMTTTIINAGTQHNVVPDRCTFTVDVRTTDAYTNEETLEIIQQHVQSEISEVSRRLQPSRIDADHVLVRAAEKLGIATYGSPTLSDQALLRLPSVKIGPGSSSRSHTANEYIKLSEIRNGIDQLIELIETIQHNI